MILVSLSKCIANTTSKYRIYTACMWRSRKPHSALCKCQATELSLILFKITAAT